LLLLLARRSERMATPRLRAVMHALILGDAESELVRIVQRLRRERPVIPANVLERAVRRGELPADTDYGLLIELCIGALHNRVYWKRLPVTPEYLATLVEWILLGAQGLAQK
jgi:hypothetical protein